VGTLKHLRWRSSCGQGPGDVFRRTYQQWQEPGGRTCLVGNVVRAQRLVKLARS